MKKNIIFSLSVIAILVCVLWIGLYFIKPFVAHDHTHEKMLASVGAVSHGHVKASTAKVPQVDERKIGEITGINDQLFNFINEKSSSTLAQGGKTIKTKDLERIKAMVKIRKELMKTLAKEDPRAFLSLALSKRQKESLPTDVQKDVETKTTLTGQLEAIHIDDFDNPQNSYFDYFVRSKTARTPLYLSAEPASAPGSKVSVPGYSIEGVFVANADSVDEIVPAPALDSTGDQRTLVLLVNFADSGPLPFTKEQAQTAIFDGQFQRFFKEQSYNKVSFSGDTYGWIQLSQNKCDDLGNCSPSVGLGYTQEIKDFVISNGIDLAGYDRVLYLMNLGESGYSGVGKSLISFNGVEYNLSETWIWTDIYYSRPSNWGNQPFEWTNLDFLLSHELGHALGVMHANGLDCDTVSMGGEECQHIEYGNYFDAMGTVGNSLHFNGLYKQMLGWITPTETLVVDAPGRYTINPLEISTSSKKVAEIRMQGTTTSPFYVEFRQGAGFDANLTSSELSSNQGGLFVNNIIRDSIQFPRLLDMSPTSATWWEDIQAVTLNLAAIPNYFKDLTSGITIGPVISADNNAITFDIQIEAPQCIRHLSKVSPNQNSSNKVVQGGTGYFGIYFTNRDSMICGDSLFDAVANLPPLWTYIVSPRGAENTSIAPGGMGWKSFVYNIPDTAAIGTYPVSFDLINSSTGQKVTANWNVDVVPAPVIYSVEPASGVSGTVVTIKGANLIGENPFFSFSNNEGYAFPVVAEVDSNTLKFTVPSLITPYCGNQGGECHLPATTTQDGIYQIQRGVNNAWATGEFTISSTTPPTASLTANGEHDTTVKIGDKISYKWSSTNADTWSSSYVTTPGSPAACTSGNPWVANNASDSLAVDAGTWQADCVYIITYVAKNSVNGIEAKDTVTVRILSPTANLTANGLHDVTVKVGDNITYAWSSLGTDSFASSYTSDNPAKCTSGTEWVAKNAGDSLTVDALPWQAGCTYYILYQAWNSKTMESKSDTVTVRITSSSTLPVSQEGFVSHLYSCVLNNPNVSNTNPGFISWLNNLKESGGKNISAVYAVFFAVKDAEPNTLSNAQYVDLAYKCILFREGTEVERQVTINLLNSGYSRSDFIRNVFLNSDAFKIGILPKIEALFIKTAFLKLSSLTASTIGAIVAVFEQITQVFR